MGKNIRKLASIRRIDDIKPIENADRIEVAKVGGWNVIVKKGEFKIGQLCVYCEIDSLLPERPEFEFLRPKHHFRIKTQKMRGIISQGIVFPLEILPEHDRLIILEEFHMNGNEHIVGQDVTEKLGITKYEPPIAPQLMGMAKGNFPVDIVPKTDEERCIHRDTIIYTEDGRKTIKEVCEFKYVGKVLCIDNEENIKYSRIIDYSISENENDWYEIELENGHKIICTGNHLLYISDLMYYKKVSEIKRDEKLLVLNDHE